MRSELTRLFRRRLQEEMALRDHMSGNELAKMAGVGQRSVARILLPDGHKDQQTPSLDVVDAIARALGVQAWFLLRDFTTAEQRRIRAPVAADPAPGVYRLPRRSQIFPPSDRSKKSRPPRRR